MIHVRISEVKNRLSHYLRLVRDGEKVEIMDRDTPVARIVNAAKFPITDRAASWQAELVPEGIITPAKENGEFPPEFFDKNNKPKRKRYSASPSWIKSRGVAMKFWDSSPTSAEFIGLFSDIIDSSPNVSHSLFIIR